MVVMATDVPPAGSVAKSDTANVVITVRRNPNGPVFTADTYEATISEYKSVQQSVVRVAASDADPDNVSRLGVCLDSLCPSQHFQSCRDDFLCSWVKLVHVLSTWVNVFRIIPEFRILRLTFHRKSASKF